MRVSQATNPLHSDSNLGPTVVIASMLTITTPERMITVHVREKTNAVGTTKNSNT